MTHQRILSFAARTAALAAVLGVVTAPAWADAQKINGTITYTSGNVTHKVGLNVHEFWTGHQAKGDLSYRNSTGLWIQGDIRFARIVGDTGWFAAKIMRASDPYLTNFWVFGKAYDNGTPKQGGDLLWMSLADEQSAVIGVLNLLPPTYFPFRGETGHISVHHDP